MKALAVPLLVVFAALLGAPLAPIGCAPVDCPMAEPAGCAAIAAPAFDCCDQPVAPVVSPAAVAAMAAIKELLAQGEIPVAVAVLAPGFTGSPVRTAPGTAPPRELLALHASLRI